MNHLRHRYFLGLLLAVSWVIFSSRLTAQDALAGDFSKRAEIEKRLAAVRAETSALPADADPELRQRLQELDAICQFHLTSLDVLIKAQAGRDAAVQALSAWRGFTESPPYSILLLDEVRETQANCAAAQRAGEAQLRIFRTEIEAARDKLDAHQQAERQFEEEASITTTPEDRQSAERSIKSEQLSSRFAAELVARLSLLRHSVTVGVDYSSPTRDVSHTLLAVAQEHGLVLKNPAPEVCFEDFGEKALVFRLHFWFDTSKVSSDTISSDLRYMIGNAFADAGLILSCPHRSA